jgi:uncharacterized protein YbjT (DUF2867 family)
MKIVVVGGTGLIGSRVVAKLRDRGHDALPAAPSTGVNALTGEGLAVALVGASVVVDVSNSPAFDAATATHFFETSTANLLGAEATAGIGHHVALSVVGTEHLLESGYFRAKLAQEELISQSAIPYSIVRATQFFEFIGSIADSATDGNSVRLAPLQIQPAAADDVASAVAAVAVNEPVNGVVEVAGPKLFRLDELVRLFFVAHNDAREVITDPNARYFSARAGERSLVPRGEARLGRTRFEEWLRRPR